MREIVTFDKWNVFSGWLSTVVLHIILLAVMALKQNHTSLRMIMLDWCLPVSICHNDTQTCRLRFSTCLGLIKLGLCRLNKNIFVDSNNLVCDCYLQYNSWHPVLTYAMHLCINMFVDLQSAVHQITNNWLTAEIISSSMLCSLLVGYGSWGTIIWNWERNSDQWWSVERST